LIGFFFTVIHEECPGVGVIVFSHIIIGWLEFSWCNNW
jgi:hypothetical protein